MYDVRRSCLEISVATEGSYTVHRTFYMDIPSFVHLGFMNIVYLLTGSNMGDRIQSLAEARMQIERNCGSISKMSPVYQTDAWGNPNQPSFLNQALAVETTLDPKSLITKILAIEKKLGRTREEKYGPRLIDIDILFFNNDVIDMPLLKVPHPEIQNRRFALVPLVAIAPALVHPVMQKTTTQLLEECPDLLEVKKVNP